MNLIAKAALVASFTIAASGVANAQNLIVNGDFEADQPGTTPPTGFTVEPDNEIVVIDGQAFIDRAGGSGDAADAANQFAAFGSGDVPNTSTLSQAFTTTAGGVFDLTFDFGAFGAGSQILNVGLFDVGTMATFFSFSVADVASTDLNTLFSTTARRFTAIGGSTRLDFSIAPQGSNSVDALLDNVSVAAVPEPATWALMMIGFGAVGYSMRRRPAYKLARTA